MTYVFIKETVKYLGHTEAQSRGHVKTESEVGQFCHQPRKSRSHWKLKRATESPTWDSSQGHNPADTLMLVFHPPELLEREREKKKGSVVFRHHIYSLLFPQPRKLMGLQIQGPEGYNQPALIFTKTASPIHWHIAYSGFLLTVLSSTERPYGQQSLRYLLPALTEKGSQPHF